MGVVCAFEWFRTCLFSIAYQVTGTCLFFAKAINFTVVAGNDGAITQVIGAIGKLKGLLIKHRAIRG